MIRKTTVIIIYLFGINREADSLRKTLLKYTQDKQAYSVKTTAGKKGQDITSLGMAICYGGNSVESVWVKGFDKEAIDSFVTNAEVRIMNWKLQSRL